MDTVSENFRNVPQAGVIKPRDLGLYPTKVRNRPYDFHIFLHKKGCIIYGISFLIMQQIFATKSFTGIRHGVSCRKYFNLCNREKIYATNEDSEHL